MFVPKSITLNKLLQFNFISFESSCSQENFSLMSNLYLASFIMTENWKHPISVINLYPTVEKIILFTNLNTVTNHYCQYILLGMLSINFSLSRGICINSCFKKIS